MSTYNDGDDDGGGVMDFAEVDEDINTNETEQVAPPVLQDNPKRSSFVEKTRRISSENTGEVDEEIDDIPSVAPDLGNTKSTTEIAEETNYDDADNDWEPEHGTGDNSNKVSSTKQESPAAFHQGQNKPQSRESEFPVEEVEDQVEAPSRNLSVRSATDFAIEEVEEVISKPAPSPPKARMVVDNDDIDDIPEIHDEIHVEAQKAVEIPRQSAPSSSATALAGIKKVAKKQPEADVDASIVSTEGDHERGTHSGGEPKKVKPEKRSAAAAKLADAAEKQALAAEQEKEDKVAALRLRAAKRQEEREAREKKELLRQQRKQAQEARREAAEAAGAGADGATPEDGEAGAEGGRDENDSAHPDEKGGLKGKLFLPNINNRAKKAAKSSAGSADNDSVEKSDGWNDDVKPEQSDSAKERHEAVQQRLKEKEERNRLLRARRAKAQARADQDGAADGEETPVETSSIHAPKPPVGRSHNRADRAGRKVGASASAASTDDGYGRVVLPQLAHPRSSPDPRAALHSLLQESEKIGAGMELGGIADDNNSYNSSSKKGRRKKPLYLRMIAKAQQQYLEDERQKHELYSEQKKSKQRGNPTAEELRQHRQKHDELVRSKQEEGRRAMAEAAAANARAVKRQQAVASIVESALQDGEGELVVDGASPQRKAKQQRKKKAKSADDGDALSLPVLNEHGHTGGPGSNARDNGFSPKKGSSSSLHSAGKPEAPASASSAANSPSSSGKAQRSLSEADADESDQITGSALFPLSTPRPTSSGPRPEASEHKRSPKRAPVEMHSIGTDTATDEPPHLPPPVAVPLDFDREAAAAAVQLIPDLSSDALTAFCAPDWMQIFSTVDDIMLVPGTAEEGASVIIGGKHMYIKGIMLGQAPPSLDARKLMFIDDEPIAEPIDE